LNRAKMVLTSVSLNPKCLTNSPLWCPHALSPGFMMYADYFILTLAKEILRPILRSKPVGVSRTVSNVRVTSSLQFLSLHLPFAHLLSLFFLPLMLELSFNIIIIFSLLWPGNPWIFALN
jgi:hypothetical protein